MRMEGEGLDWPGARLQRERGADSGLLPFDVMEVGIVPERGGWHVYCERTPGGEFMEDEQVHFIPAHRGMAHAVGQLAEWMGREWGFGGTRAREAAWRLFGDARR